MRNGSPTVADFERLRAEFLRLSAHTDALRKTVREQAAALNVQFIRIADMQAVLDEERIANQRLAKD